MAEKKKNLRLNCVSVGTEAVFHVLIGLFSVCCIIPFLFVIIISFSSKESITTIGYSFIPTSWSMTLTSMRSISCPRSGAPTLTPSTSRSSARC